jgi:hypothetical protein
LANGLPELANPPSTVANVTRRETEGVGRQPAERAPAIWVGGPRREPDRPSASETPRRLTVPGPMVARRITSPAPRQAIASFLVVLTLTGLQGLLCGPPTRITG